MLSKKFIVVALMILSLLPSSIALGAGSDFLKTINRGKKIDPYDPITRANYYVVGIQEGSHSKYTTNDPSLIYGRFYLLPELSLGAKIERGNMDNLSLGGEYKIGRLLGDKTWLGVHFYPDGAEIKTHLRGIYYLSRNSMLHFQGDFTIVEDGTQLGGHGGFYSQPFRASKNTFIDSRASFRYLSQDGFSATNMNLKAEIGHSWGYLADQRGLEAYGSIGLEWASVSIDSDFGNSSDSDTDIAIMIGILYNDIL